MKRLNSVDFKDKLFAAYNERLAQSLKQAISQQDPTIDWSQAEMVVDFEIGHFHVESKSEAVHGQIQAAFGLVLAKVAQRKQDHQFPGS